MQRKINVTRFSLYTTTLHNDKSAYRIVPIICGESTSRVVSTGTPATGTPGDDDGPMGSFGVEQRIEAYAVD